MPCWLQGLLMYYTGFALGILMMWGYRRRWKREKARADSTEQMFDTLKEGYADLKERYSKIVEERDRVASGKVTCEDCNAILARF